MIKGRVRKYWTLEEIRKALGDWTIWAYYVGNFTPGRCIKSPLRGERNPSFLLSYNEKGNISFCDLAHTDIHGDFVDFLKLRYGLRSLQEVLEKIVHDFGLETGIVSPNVIKLQEEEKKISKEKVYPVFNVIAKKFTTEDIAYWGQYGIDKDTLKREEVYSIKEFYIDGKRSFISKDELAYAYYFNKEEYGREGFKIYRPYAKNKKDKWRFNMPYDTVEKLHQNLPCDTIVITKSRKDRILLARYLPNVASVQGERLQSINDADILDLKQKANKVLINFDVDSVGKSNSWKFTEAYNFGHLNVPDIYLKEGLKDYTDLYAKYGEEPIIKHLKEKGLI